MFDKPRKTTSLLILESLNKRKTLSSDHLTSYKRLHRGYIGERRFAEMIREQLADSHIQLYGLQLKADGSEFQIDCTLIFQNEIYLIEIKNFFGDYYYENNNFFLASSKKVISNPLQQLQRSEILLRQFLSEVESNLELRTFVIFMNPCFQLYQAPMSPHIIYPAQVARFINSLNAIPSNLNSQHKRLSELFKTAHLTESKFEQIPEYNYDDLKKGIICADCNGFMKLIQKSRSLICQKCNIIEPINSGAIRSIEEFKLLFPDRPITVSIIIEWCGFVLSRRKVRYILKENLTLHNNGRYSRYSLGSRNED